MAEQRAHQKNRRRHARVPVGLPVQIRISGRAKPLMVELIDIAEGGVRFRSLADVAQLDQRAAFTFVASGLGTCSAEGHVLRVHPGGEFILALDRANKTFREFVGSLGT